MKRVLCLFDYIASTGFGTVSNNILKELKKHYGDNLYFDVVAVNYFGESFYQDKNTYVMSGKLNDDKQDDFGRYFFLKKLKENNYDGVFIVQDLGIITPILELVDYINKEKKENKIKQFKTIYYFPVDCEMIPELCKNLEVCDLIVTYNEYGRKIVLKHRPELKGKVKVIPHGNNSKNFYPLPEEDVKRFRQEYFGENADKFIITNVNRNQPRKDLPNTIFGFIEAKEIWKNKIFENLVLSKQRGYKEPFLYLHCHPQDPMGWDLRVLLRQTELEEDRDYKLLPRELENNLADIETLNKIYNASDLFISTTLGEGWGLCLSSDSQILTSNGCKKIKDVNIGDLVMTNSGIFERVLDTTTRKIDSYIEVKTKYGYMVEATHEHPYYSLVDKKEKYRKISELKKGDYLAIVKQNKLAGGFNKNIIDLLQYLPNKKEWKFNDKFIFNKLGFSPKNKKWSIANICKKYSTTKKIVENSIDYIIGKKQKVSETAYTLANNLIADGFDKPMPLKINRYVQLNEDVLWIFGWYLAEGSCEGGKRLEFSMGIDELNDANRIAQIIKSNFGVKDVVVRVFKNKCAVRVSSVALALFFKQMFGNGALNKRIPEILFIHPEELMPLVDGYIKGDGHIDLTKDHISFSSISPSLAYQMQSIFVTNGIMLSVRKEKKRGIGVYDKYICTIPLSHLRKYIDLVGIKGILNRESKRNHNQDFIETDTHFFVPIISIKEIKKDDEFYDLCVENSHSFVANGLVCHNTFSEAASCRIPIVAPYSTSFIEMSNYGKNAWMLDVFRFANMDNFIRWQTDQYEIGEKIFEVYKGKMNDSVEYRTKIQKSFEWAKSLEWNIVCKKWIEYFKIF